VRENRDRIASSSWVRKATIDRFSNTGPRVHHPGLGFREAQHAFMMIYTLSACREGKQLVFNFLRRHLLQLISADWNPAPKEFGWARADGDAATSKHYADAALMRVS
jgi:hypothetical protein